MAVNAKDGTRHHSASRASLHDQLTANRPKGGGGPPDKELTPASDQDKRGAEHKEGEHDVSHMDIGEVVKLHGPAHHIVVHHHDETKTHTVTSHHGEEGHMHHSEHGSRKEAHAHADKAAGLGENKETEDGEPFEEAMETPETENAEMARAGGGIPGIGS